MLSRPEAELSVATIVHEATHQIAFNSGLQTRFADVPLWISEGIAVFFETPDLESAKGWRTIGAVNSARLAQFQRYLADRPPTSLKTLISTLYPTGRFSGGTNYVDTLADILNVPVENYAVGGALAGTFPVPFGTGVANNTNCGPAGVAGSAAICPLGFTYEVDQFLNVGAQDPLFPAGSGTFDESDLVVVSIGGNDARYYQQNYSSAFPAAPFIAGSIAGATANLDRLVAAGAPTISFLAGDTGRLPEVFGDPAAAAIRTSYSTAFNTAM